MATLTKAPWSLLRSLGTRLLEVHRGGNPDRSYAQFRHECEIEAERGAGSYGLVRLFIWAMPILGFIGTVMGIGDAVSEFAGFLTGDIEDVEVVKSQLSNVSQGLSFAFDTTLLGLGASLVAMVLVSLVQRQEESLLSDVEQAGLALLEAGRRVEAPTPATVTGDAEALAATLRSLAVGFHEHTRALTEASQRLEGEMAPLRASIDLHTERASGATVPRELMESVTALRESSRAMLEASKTLTSAGGGRRTVERLRPEAPERRAARQVQAVASAGTHEVVEPIFTKPARESFWRAPWTGSAESAAMMKDAVEDEPEFDSPESLTEDTPETRAFSRNRWAVMWGFGLLFLGTGSAVVAGWLVDRVLIPPDFALVSLILGATFWCMGALSDQP